MNNTNSSLESIKIIGIAVRTINRDRRAGKDIKALWGRFFREHILNAIPNKENEDLYNIYTNYSSDHLDWYDCILGCKVNSLANIPEGMTGITIPASNYKVYLSKGELPKVVLDTWEQIWSSDIDRAYKADFDLYGSKAKDPANAVVKTFLSVM